MIRDPDAEHDDAAQSIIDDYLSMGESYPPKGGPEFVTMGNFLMATLEEDDIAPALDAIASGDPDRLESLKHRFWNLAGDGDLVHWLGEKHPELVNRRIQELREEARERAEEELEP